MADYSRAIQGVSESMQRLVSGEQEASLKKTTLEADIEERIRRDERLDEQDQRAIELHTAKMAEIKEVQRKRKIEREQEESDKTIPFNLAQSPLVQGASPTQTMWLAEKTQGLASIFSLGHKGEVDTTGIGMEGGVAPGKGAFYDPETGQIMVRQKDGSVLPISKWEFNQKANQVAMTLGMDTDGLEILKDAVSQGRPDAKERLDKAMADLPGL